MAKIAAPPGIPCWTVFNMVLHFFQFHLHAWQNTVCLATRCTQFAETDCAVSVLFKLDLQIQLSAETLPAGFDARLIDPGIFLNASSEIVIHTQSILSWCQKLLVMYFRHQSLLMIMTVFQGTAYSV